MSAEHCGALLAMIAGFYCPITFRGTFFQNAILFIDISNNSNDHPDVSDFESLKIWNALEKVKTFAPKFWEGGGDLQTLTANWIHLYLLLFCLPVIYIFNNTAMCTS